MYMYRLNYAGSTYPFKNFEIEKYIPEKCLWLMFEN